MIPSNIKAHLDANDVVYRHHAHPQEFTSPEVAEALEMTGKAYAKTVIVVIDGELVMAAVPANERVDVEKLARMAGASSVRLASEDEFQGAFPGCEVGAMPPLGDLFEMPVWLDESFERRPTIAFDAGTHTDTLEMGVADFRRLVRPKIARLTEVDESAAAAAVVSMASAEQRVDLTGLAPFLRDWTAARRAQPLSLELTRREGPTIVERGVPLVAARVEAQGPDAPALEITLGTEGGGDRVTHRLSRLVALAVKLGDADHPEELVFEGEGGAKAVVRVAPPAVKRT